MHLLLAKDNGLYFFRSIDAQRCEACGSLTNKWNEDISSVLIAKNIVDDVSYSYDGVLVVTDKFISSLHSLGIEGMIFTPLQNKLFSARPRNYVEFDAIRRATKFDKFCEACGIYKSVAGATPAFLKSPLTNSLELFRTDIEFGSEDEKTPLVLCDPNTASLLGKAGLRGLHFRFIGSK